MTPYVEKHVPSKDLELFRRIERLVHQLPDLDLGKDERGEPIILSCHMICRALARMFPDVRVQDGRFAHVAQHSWLITKRGWVIDPYPVGILGGPLLVGHEISIYFHLYCEQPLTVSAFSQDSFHRSVDRIGAVLQELDTELVHLP